MFDSLFGVFVVAMSLLGFISLVWLKDQLSSGETPNWLVVDRNTARLQQEEDRKRRIESRKEAVGTAASFSRSNQNSTERKALDRHLKYLESRLEVTLL